LSAVVAPILSDKRVEMPCNRLGRHCSNLGRKRMSKPTYTNTRTHDFCKIDFYENDPYEPAYTSMKTT
jgi:hypothetical protein